MAFLLRVELPDIPGSLGALATALGSAGADIEAIEIVEHRADGKAVDDVLLELPPTTMPDALITACHKLEGVRVQWISRYNAGANLSMDLEAVEAFTEDPSRAIERLVDLIPATFRADWALMLVSVDGVATVAHRSSTAPMDVPEAQNWFAIMESTAIEDGEDTILAATPGKDGEGKHFVVIFGRHGVPEVLNSELARLRHMVSLAASVASV
ncbi:MAG: hypothetical protein JWP10_469 [Nocardioidaceae bacterium]|nr:hypothetical protein [Nocardioidaceae bacterium]